MNQFILIDFLAMKLYTLLMGQLHVTIKWDLKRALTSPFNLLNSFVSSFLAIINLKL